jgi:hypothetical protein
MQRRKLVLGTLTLLGARLLPARAAALPGEVAGVKLPGSALARGAAAFARVHSPEFLFNHCMRTFLFGALQLQRNKLAYRAEDAFVAAAMHDLGLLPQFETAAGSFELDGADAAEHWARAQGAASGQADRIWHAVEMHDGAFALTQRQGPEAELVARGAGTDVYGPAADMFAAGQVDEVLAAFPRLKFKQEFTSLLVAHCARKPASQRATWLEGTCRAHAAAAPSDDAVAQHIAAAGFAE